MNHLLPRIQEVLRTAECNHDDFESVMGYCQMLRSSLEATPASPDQLKWALAHLVTALDGRAGATELVSEIDEILDQFDVPEGYRVYRTLVGTWRWSRGEFGTETWVDGENLPTKDDAVKDAIADAQRQKELSA